MGARTDSIVALPEALRWIAAYERRVIESLGPSYRWATAASGPEAKISAIELSRHWSRLAVEIEDWMKPTETIPGSTHSTLHQQATL